MANSEIIGKLKQSVERQIVKNKEIVDIIDSPYKDKEGWVPFYLIDSEATAETNFKPSIYSYYKFPSIIEDDVTFMCIMINTTNGSRDNNFITAELHIVIFTHKDHILIKDNAITENRNDYLSKLLDAQFNGQSIKYDGTDVSIGKFYLYSNVEDSYDNNFLMRHLTFICNDINAAAC